MSQNNGLVGVVLLNCLLVHRIWFLSIFLLRLYWIESLCYANCSNTETNSIVLCNWNNIYLLQKNVTNAFLLPVKNYFKKSDKRWRSYEIPCLRFKYHHNSASGNWSSRVKVIVYRIDITFIWNVSRPLSMWQKVGDK